eukprot:jgi/Orpsp1_1/1183815/evm.model.c7180000086806.1
MNGETEQDINGENLLIKIIYKEVTKSPGESALVINERIMVGHHKNGTLYHLGFRISNKNTKTISQVKECYDKNVIEQYVNNPNASERFRTEEPQQSLFIVKKLNEKNQNFEEFITLRNCGVLDPSRPFMDVTLHTNTTKEENGFWVYVFAIVEENEENEEDGSIRKVNFSSVHNLMSHKQMFKRGNKSYYKNQLKLLKTGKENSVKYFCDSMFELNPKNGKYDFKNVFNFGINFYEVKTEIVNTEVVEELNKSRCCNYISDEELKNVKLLPSPTLTEESIQLSPTLAENAVQVKAEDVDVEELYKAEYCNYINDEELKNVKLLPSPTLTEGSIQLSPSLNGNAVHLPQNLNEYIANPIDFNNTVESLLGNYVNDNSIESYVSQIFAAENIINDNLNLNPKFNNDNVNNYPLLPSSFESFMNYDINNILSMVNGIPQPPFMNESEIMKNNFYPGMNFEFFIKNKLNSSVANPFIPTPVGPEVDLLLNQFANSFIPAPTGPE